MTNIFISYSRKDSPVAQNLVEALESESLDIWIDWEDIPPTADWMEQIHKGIQDSDAFLFLLSPASVKSEVCGREVDHAVQNGKRLIPIVVRDIDPNEVHPALAKINWIYCREKDEFDRAVEKTLSAICADLEWAESHRRLQVRALEWEQRKERSLLLRGNDLREAEEQLSTAGQKDPVPTDLQRQFILASRTGETRTRNTFLVIALVVMVALAIASVIAVNQSSYATNQASTAVAESNMRGTAEANAVAEANSRATAQANAEEQSKNSHSRAVAALSTTYRESSPQLSMLLAAKAFQTADTYEARNSLLTALQLYPPDSTCKGDVSACLIVNQMPFQGDAVTVAFSPDGRLIAVGGCSSGGGSLCQEGQVIVWEYPTWKMVGNLQLDKGYIWVITFSPDNHTLAVGTDRGVVLWDTQNNEEMSFQASGRDMVLTLAFNPDGSQLVSAGTYLSVWNTITGSQTITIDKNDLPIAYSAAFDPQDLILAIGGCATPSDPCREGKIAFFDTETYQPSGEPITGLSSEVMGIAFSENGVRLVSTNVEGHVIVWDMETRTPYGLPLNDRGQISSAFYFSTIAFSPDRNILGTAVGDEKVIILLDIPSRQPLGMPIKTPDTRIKGLSFNANGKALASVDHYGIKIWDINPDRWMELVCESAGRNFSQAEWVTFFPDEAYQKTCPQWPGGE